MRKRYAAVASSWSRRRAADHPHDLRSPGSLRRLPRDLRRSTACQPLSRADVRSAGADPHGNVVRDPREHPDAIAGTSPRRILSSPSRKIRCFATAASSSSAISRGWERLRAAPGDMDCPRTVAAMAWPCDQCVALAATRSTTHRAQTRHGMEFGCERCHGPGSVTSRGRSRPTSSPARLTPVLVMCPSVPLGRPSAWPIGGPSFIGGRLFAWASTSRFSATRPSTRWDAGRRCIWGRQRPRNRMQGNDFVQSLMYAAA